MSDPLDKLLAEVRRDLGTAEAKTLDWSGVDAALFARMGEAQRAERARFAPQRRRVGTIAAVAFAAAGTLAAVIVGKTHEPLEREGTTAAESAGTLVAIDGDGRVLVNGAPVSSGVGLGLGDVLETRGAQATIERPGKLRLTLEPGSRTAVAHVRGALVVALESGAIEAQVVPVAAGEAFAVDVGTSRVAVHGTHLRVARAGDRVVVDLNEGVISVGEAPRFGSVEGAMINAPAHVEFIAGDALGTLTQAHDAAAVRGGDSWSRGSRGLGALTGPKLPSPKPESSASRLGSSSSAEGHPEPRSASSVGPKSAVTIERNATAAIASAVHMCMSERPRADNVTVVVSTALHLELADDGSVRTARFEPPVAPDVNACAVQSIYKARFAHGGSITIPIDFTN
jgi:ferric-dicitrate binding protein FerR (iron transport regulator)